MMTPTKPPPPPPPVMAQWPTIKTPGQSCSSADAMDTSREAFERECSPEKPQEDEWTSVHGA
eukprot:4938171-Karenia_brevis.AAC.1